MNVEIGTFLGIFVSNFRHFVIAVWETEHYNSVLEIIVSVLGIPTWEPDIYIGFSSALHLQCMCDLSDDD
jgi:hypothetical protein